MRQAGARRTHGGGAHPLPREGPPWGAGGVTGWGWGDVWLVITSLSKDLCCVEPGAAPLRGVWWGGGARLGPGLLAVSRGPHTTHRFPGQVTRRKAGFWGTS